jgi:hypothetical protein
MTCSVDLYNGYPWFESAQIRVIRRSQEVRGPSAIEHADLVNLQGKYVDAEMLIGSLPVWGTTCRGEHEISAPVDV